LVGNGARVTEQPPLAERDVVDRLKAGHADALAQVYDLYAPTVYRIGYHLLGDSEEADDLVQDVFVGLSRAVRTFEGRGTFEGWLKRVATRTALMKLRQQQNRRRLLWRERARLTRSEQEAPVAERLDLEHALRQLDPILRAVFVLKDMEDHTHEEIAELLGISVGAARVRLHRARRKLRQYLGRDV
jgi:RNA polymerase sigma-70 factor (ECF subfamily)